MSKIVFNLQGEINALNFKQNGSKERDFSSNFDAKVFELKNIFDENYTKLLQSHNSDSVFMQSLIVDYQTLKDKSVNVQSIEDLLDDFHAKFNSFDLGLEQNEIATVAVEVTTFDSSLKKISGYYVYWNFWLDKDNPNPYAHFNQFTSPSSSELLTPSVYDIWVQKPGDSRQFPPKSQRTKNIIFLSDTEKIKSITIIIR
jgi:hypothetical protein